MSIGKFVMMLSTLAMLGTATAVQAERGVRWSGDVVPFRPNILHAPDNRYLSLGPPVTVRDFGPGMRHPGLKRLLDVSRNEFARADVIAFEANGGHGAGVEQGWESSIWTFTDGTNSYVATFNELAGRGSDPAVVATGSVIGPDGTIFSGNAAYSSFFRMCCPDPLSPVISYILFDLHSVSPAIDTDSPSFTIKIESGFVPGGSFGEGTPDPDAIGILTRGSSACAQ